MKPFIASLLAASLSLVSQAASPTVPTAFRVLSFNIHHGEGIDQKLDVARIAALIVKEKADIVALQEVDRGVARTARRDLPGELAKLTGLAVYFDRNIDHQGGEYGNAVLTNFPVKERKNTPLQTRGTGEQRGLSQLLLEVHGRDVLFLNTHFDSRPNDAERLSSATEVKNIVAAAGKIAVVFCGDFNDVPESRTHRAMKESLSDSWELVGLGNGATIPTKKPTKRIDYIWITPATVEPLRMTVLESVASDHLPVLGEFRLR